MSPHELEAAIVADRAATEATRRALAAQRERQRDRAAAIVAEQDANAARRAAQAEAARFAGLQRLAPRDADVCARVEIGEDGALYGEPICESLLREYHNGRAAKPPGYHAHPRESEMQQARRQSGTAWRRFASDVLDMARVSPAHFLGDEGALAALIAKLAEGAGLDASEARAGNVAKTVIAARGSES